MDGYKKYIQTVILFLFKIDLQIINHQIIAINFFLFFTINVETILFLINENILKHSTKNKYHALDYLLT
jgi:hypothetical protein